jgi:WD40 repeat protein
MPHIAKSQGDSVNGVTSIAWDVSSLQLILQRQGLKMVTSSEDQYIRLWDQKGNPLKVMKDHKDSVNVARWNKESTVIATAGFDKRVLVSLNLI